MLDGLSRFVRAWLVALVVAFIATNVAHRWLGLPVHSILGIDPSMRFGFFWQWFTHPWVELPSGFELVGFLIVLFVVYSTLPRLESTRGRRTVMTVMAAGTVVPGVVALALAYVFPASLKLPVCGFWAPLFALWAYEAYMLRGVTGLRVSPLGAGPGIPMSGEQLLGMLVAFAVLRLILNVLPIHFAADLASIAAGVGVAWAHKGGRGRPTTTRRKSPPGMRVVRGSDDHKVFHRGI